MPELQHRWKTADGKYLKVGEMTDDHLVNAMKVMKKRTFKMIADAAAIHNIDVDWDKLVPNIFTLMLSESRRRGLSYDPYNDMYEKIRKHRVQYAQSSEVRRAFKKYADTLTKPREIDLDT